MPLEMLGMRDEMLGMHRKMLGMHRKMLGMHRKMLGMPHPDATGPDISVVNRCFFQHRSATYKVNPCIMVES